MYGTNVGLMIIDLQFLPKTVKFLKSYTHESDIRSHNLSIDTTSGYAYIVKQDYSGFRVVSLEDPENPVDVSAIYTPNVHDVFAQNDTVYVAEGESGSFSIYDLTEKTDPELLARVDIPAAGFIHNIWATQSGEYVMTTEETPDKAVKIWDIRDFSNVNLLGEYLGPNKLAHSVHILENFAFISHYTAGITILDISDQRNLLEVTSFDTYPQNDNPSFHGCWGVYPFTSNGFVYASNMEGYLTVWRFSQAEISVANVAKIPREPVTLSQNYPNPFNPITTLRYDLPERSNVSITIYDILGRKVRTLVQSVEEPGYKSILWDGTDDLGQQLSAGVNETSFP